MAKVARSSTNKKNINKLVFQRQKIYLQTHPGDWGETAERAIAPNLEFTLRQNGQFSQSGLFASDGSAEVLIQGGCKAQFEALGSQYELQPLLQLYPSNTLLGVQQRLRLLGYLDREPNELWDQAIDRAILNFQADYGFDTNGKLCGNTINGIKEALGE